jgi:transcriptional regulator with XRE-family HTH domain
VEPREVVGQNIRQRRAELDITQEAAANAAGIHPVEFARAERGLRDLRISTIVKIARGLSVPAGDLLRGLP